LIDCYSGVPNQLAVDLVSEIGRRVSPVTEDPRETMFLFQQLSRNFGVIPSHFCHFCQLRSVTVAAYNILACRLCAGMS